MINHNINPVLFDFGVLEIRYYGFVYVLGVLFTLFILIKFADRIKNFNKERAYDLVLYMIVGMIVGARLGYFLFFDFSSWMNNFFEIFKIWHGGMSFHGALLGIIVGTLIFCKKYKIKFYSIADIVVIPVAFSLFLGRIANFINAELIGVKSNMFFCINYTGIEGCRHPSQIYEALKNLGIFFYLYYLYTKKKFKEGYLFWNWIMLYGFFRLLTNFFREDPLYYGLSTGQWFSFLMFIVGFVVLWRNYWFSKK